MVRPVARQASTQAWLTSGTTTMATLAAGAASLVWHILLASLCLIVRCGVAGVSRARWER